MTTDFDRFIAGLRDGDAVVHAEFVDRYRPALERLADRRIQAAAQRRVGPESIAQSVCRTFLRRASDGQFAFEDEGALWGLLCAIALTKVREHVRFHTRQKRDLGREESLGSIHAASTTADTPSHDAVVAFEDQFAVVLDGFDKEERQMLELRVQGHTQQQIGEMLGCSERTVRRLLANLEARMRAALVAK